MTIVACLGDDEAMVFLMCMMRLLFSVKWEMVKYARVWNLSVQPYCVLFVLAASCGKLCDCDMHRVIV